MPIEPYSRLEKFQFGSSDSGSKPIQVTYLMGRFKGNRGPPIPDGENEWESVTLGFGERHHILRRGIVNVIKMNGIPISEYMETTIKKIKHLDTETLSALSELPDYVRNVIEV